jgi:NADPH:quinone reductase-like Zn-dependent oxidoreductase
LGFDVSGTVESVGPGVETFAVGDRVFGRAWRTYASRCVVKAADLARIPEGIDAIEAAALPTVTTTGAQLAELATRGKTSGTVLVTGALGNVGRSAVLVAKEHGWTVIAGVLKARLEEARAAGADSAVPLDDDLATKSLPPLDAVADTILGPVAARLIARVKEGGIFASVLARPNNASDYPSVRAEEMRVKPAPVTLLHMANAVKEGRLVIPLGQRFVFADASKAHLAAESGERGKLLLTPT